MNKIIPYKTITTREKGDTMCKPLSRIYGKSAEELLKLYGDTKQVPVSLNTIIKNIGISLVKSDFSQLEKKIGANEGEILGLVAAKGDNAAIFYKSSESYEEQRFTIAHEIAHCCLHMSDYNEPYLEFRKEASTNDNKEDEANYFAESLLIPLDRLHEVYSKLLIPNTVALASKFQVPVERMEERLNHLKISHFDKNGKVVDYTYG